MHILGFVAPADRIGKTALALGLVASAQRAGCGPVAFVDADPQSELRRGASEMSVEGVNLVAAKPSDVRRHLARLQRDGVVLVAVDAPESPPGEIETALAPANLVVIPVAPSEEGLRSVGATVDLVDQCGKPFVFVINGTAPGEEIDVTVAMALVQHGALSPIVVPRRDESARARLRGANGGTDQQRDAEEAVMSQLWTYIEGRLKKVADPEFRGATIPASSRERRKFPRWELGWKATIIMGDDRRECTVADISGGGMAIHVARPPAEGANVTVETPVLGRLAATVVHVTGEKVGLRFLLDAAEKWRLSGRLSKLAESMHKEQTAGSRETAGQNPAATQTGAADAMPGDPSPRAGLEAIDQSAAPSQSMAAHARFHPLALLFPMMGGEELGELAEDIKANGLREPIVIMPAPDGRILDGRHRYLACARAGIEPHFRTFTGDDPAAYVISANLRRRHLKESQRAMVAAKLANLNEGRPSRIAQDYAVSQGQAATMLGVSRRSVQSAKIVQVHGAPELVDAVERGRVSVNTASKVARRPLNEQSQLVEAGPRRMRDAVNEALTADLRLSEPGQAAEPTGRMDAAAIGSDGKHRLDLTTDPTMRRGQWLTLKVPLWQLAALTLTPEQAAAAVPPPERADVSQKLATVAEWLARLAELLKQVEHADVKPQSNDTVAPGPH